MDTFSNIELDELDAWSEINTLLPDPALSSNASRSGWPDYIWFSVLFIWSPFSALWTLTRSSVYMMKRVIKNNLTVILSIHIFAWWFIAMYIALVALDPSSPTLLPRQW